VARIAHVENRDFHTVVSHGLELGEEMEVVFGHVTGPQQQIESNFHEGAMLGTVNAPRNTAVAENEARIGGERKRLQCFAFPK
jgi:hypothetical protein